MTRFEWFEQGYGQQAYHMGIIRADVFMKFIRYKVYLDFLDQGNSISTAIELAAERNHCDRATMYRSIKYCRE